MTTDPQHYTGQAVTAVTAAARAEHDLGGWLSLVLVRAAARLGSLDALTAGRPGSWEAELVDRLARGLAGDDDLAAYATPMPADPHDHNRPGVADQRAAVTAASALVLGNDDLAHQAAEAGTCPHCTALAGISLGIALAGELTGDQGPFVSQSLRLRLLPLLKITLAELDSAPN
jgi:hypothetical protein